MCESLRGILVPLPNPCFEDDSLDFSSLEKHFDRMLHAPVNGMYINGGTGDSGKMTQEERLIIARELVPDIKKAGKTAVVHVGQTPLRNAVQLAEEAVKLNADAIASIPPKADWPLIVDFYKTLCRTGAKVIVYYIPGVTGMTAGFNQLRMLMDIPGVAGIKFSDYNVFLIRSVKLAYPQHIVYTGLDEMLVPGLLYGADGVIGTWINLFPRMYAAVYDLIQRDRLNAVLPLMNDFTAFLSIGWQWGIIDTFEALMHEKGWINRCFRRPNTWNPQKIPKDVIHDLLNRIDLIEEAACRLSV